MEIDTRFFERLVKTFETNHHIVRNNTDSLNITEAWIAFGDQQINQCKSIVYAAKTSEEHDAVFNQMSEILESEFNEDMFNLSLEKTMEKIEDFKDSVIIEDDNDQ